MDRVPRTELAHRLLPARVALPGEALLAFTGLAKSVDRSLKTSLSESARPAGASIEPAVRSTLAGLPQETCQLRDTLAAYLATRDEALMVSSFTDDRPVRDGGRARFADNWELSAQRALSVTRVLIEDGLTAAVFAAAFGAGQPVASNANAAGRAHNRRVEMAPMPRPMPGASAASAPPS